MGFTFPYSFPLTSFNLSRGSSTPVDETSVPYGTSDDVHLFTYPHVHSPPQKVKRKKKRRIDEASTPLECFEAPQPERASSVHLEAAVPPLGMFLFS